MIDQQLLAEQLRRYQSQADTQAPQGRMAGRIYARPHALEYLAAGLRGYGGMKGVEDTQGKMRDMEAQKQAAMAQALTGFGQTMQGTPAREEINVDEGPGANTFFRPAAPAQPGDPMAAYQGLVSSGVPDLQKIGMQGVATTAQAQQQRAQLLADQEREAARKAAEQQRILQVLSGAQTPQAALAAGVPAELVKTYFDQGLGKTKGAVVNGQIVDPYAIGTTVPQQARQPNMATDLLIPDPANPGRFIVNQALADVKGKIAEKGASRTSTTVNLPDKKFYEGIGSSVSDAVAAAHKQALSAADSLGNANQMARTLDKAFIGPLANQRLTLARIGSVLGVAGKDDNEKLVATRNLMQGLARQELAAAGQMKGQGQITESERAILRKAEAGEIADFSKPELETFISAIRKTSRARIAVHNANLEKLSADPQAKGLVDFLRVEVPQDVGAAPANKGGFEILNVRP